MRYYFLILLIISTILITLTVTAPDRKSKNSEKSDDEELSNLQIQVNAPDGKGFVHSALPIEARAHGARLHGGQSKPSIGDDVLIPFDDPNFE
ncbi:uncharacterized protein CELE_Y52B11B.1 [Caenorhabditis elegans]|uniref:Secreted protein n=1 Tax=Caenorhabditis elegans TaxID=6239 RepID=Q9XWM7_CAEEL|nr:Secreted protein [Caenorhabditis elegans]CAA21626.1 Secreted protein [Caenorhabditis elegans]|eukprot:NP_492864.1 Uncharacterized protein CELE_Y52B11B.1 [Caenorhabditis elegans]